MPFILALFFLLLQVGAQTSKAPTSARVGSLAPAPSVAPAPKDAPVPASATKPSVSGKADVQDRQFFFKNPVADMVAVQSLSASASSSSGSTGGSSALNTLLMASMLKSSSSSSSRPRHSQRFSPPVSSSRGSFMQSPMAVQSSAFARAPQVAVPVQVQRGFQNGFSAPATFQGGFSAPSTFQGGFVQQPAFVAPPPPTFVQGGVQGGFSGRNGRHDDNQDDPLKKVVLLSGITSGKINPLTAVAMDRNQGMSAAETAVVSSLGDGASTLVALSGGLNGNGGSQGGLFGNTRSGSGNNLLTTVMVANALTPKSEEEKKNNNAASTLATIALLSKMQDKDDSYGY